MTDIILDCTDYLHELVEKQQVDAECLMYAKYLIKVKCGLCDDDEICIYRIQTGINKEYDAEDGVAIIEFQRTHFSAVLSAQNLELYAGASQRPKMTVMCNNPNITEISDPRNNYALSVRDIVNIIINYDEFHGFESRSVTEYRKHSHMNSMLCDIQNGSPMLTL